MDALTLSRLGVKHTKSAVAESQDQYRARHDNPSHFLRDCQRALQR